MFLLNYLQIINNLAKYLFQQQQKVVMMNIFFHWNVFDTLSFSVYYGKRKVFGFHSVYLIFVVIS